MHNVIITSTSQKTAYKTLATQFYHGRFISICIGLTLLFSISCGNEDSLAGLPVEQLVWEGSYYCPAPQGWTSLILTTKRSRNNQVTATWAFGPHPDSLGIVPSGSYTLVGTYDANKNTFDLEPNAWLEQPDPTWRMLGITGKYIASPERIVGRVKDGLDLCTEFEVTRTTL